MIKKIISLIAVAFIGVGAACGSGQTKNVELPVESETITETETTSEIETTTETETKMETIIESSQSETEQDENKEAIIDSRFYDNESKRALLSQQGQVHSDSFITIDGNWIYGMDWNDEGEPLLVKERLEGGDYTVLDYYQASYINIVDGYIYYAINSYDYDDDIQGIYRMRTSGTDRERIVACSEPFIQIAGDYIYYTTDNWIDYEDLSEDSCHLYRCRLDGSNQEEILAKPVFWWFVFENGIIYQDDRDGETIHVYDTNTKTDKRITNASSFNPIYDGDYVYYLAYDPDIEGVQIRKVRIDGTEDQLVSENIIFEPNYIVTMDKIYFSFAEDENRIYMMDKDGSNLEQIGQDINCNHLAMIGDKLLYMVNAEDFEYAEGIIMCNLDGSNPIRIVFDE